ncbi:hypothetical protein SBOR_4957 [Sclerotinia borealis F-4128]|uniref:CUT domain-containing protein n=1 Tax=Sclerotinia borealis (strain F-4128) TaxID=1432307 RepID=W9CFG4_SCLBF|nr:hypothetical protein SBOR_4957 [Sclerotinia borealis F-4128]
MSRSPRFRPRLLLDHPVHTQSLSAMDDCPSETQSLSSMEDYPSQTQPLSSMDRPPPRRHLEPSTFHNRIDIADRVVDKVVDKVASTLSTQQTEHVQTLLAQKNENDKQLLNMMMGFTGQETKDAREQLNERFETQIEEGRKREEEQKELVSALREEIENEKEEVGKWKERAKSLEIQKGEVEKEGKREKERWEEVLEGKEGEIRELREEIEVERVEVARLDSEVESVMRERDDARRRVKRMELDQVNLTERMRSVDEEKRIMQQDLTLKIENAGELKGEISELKRTIEKWRAVAIIAGPVFQYLANWYSSKESVAATEAYMEDFLRDEGVTI